MTMPVRSLPVAQNWDCSGCGACCRVYRVPVTADERKRIEAQGWEAEADLKDTPYFVADKTGDWLNHRPDGACVFLGPDNLCRIHAKFGSAGKPLACRVYPFLLVPAGDHWRVGLRFACPMAAEDKGRPLADHLPEVREYAAALEADSPGVADAPPVPLEPGRSVPWADLARMAAAVSGMLGDTALTLERRWRAVLKLAELGRGLRLDGPKPVTGNRLTEFVRSLGRAAAEETPDAAEVPPPGWVGRMVFRQLLAVYARRDHGAEKGTAQRTALGRIRAAARFARGTGRIPKVISLIPDGARFEDAEQPAGELSRQSEALLTRSYRQKVESLQFCGPPNFGVPFWEGLVSLAVTFPAVLWLARVLAAGGMEPDAAVTRALRVVDDNFGFNKLLGLGRQKFALRLLAGRGEAARLVAWYGR
ncbi:MAG: YkgJ family cysteine cluster protein [Gemmataceae bacterium]|nr:YkgJ family cysteine cluster protein [Gemmataceae bacterium]